MANRWSVDDMVRIASYGGGFQVDASSISVDDAVRIASYAKSNGARIEYRNTSHWTVDDAVRVGSYGKGCAFFLP